MKLIILLISLSIVAACGSGVNNGIDPNSIDELRAHVRFVSAPNERVIEVTFYRSLTQSANTAANTESGKNVIPVDNPMFNEVAMTASTNEAGQPIYTIDARSNKNPNLVSATIGGRKFEGRTVLGIGVNTMAFVTLVPVTKS